MKVFVINDIELLVRLIKHNLLNHIGANCTIAVSSIRLTDYSSSIQNLINSKDYIKKLFEEGFECWFEDKSKDLSITELSSIYITLKNENNCLVISNEDYYLIFEAEKLCITFKLFDEFIKDVLNDENMIKIYDLIKRA